MLLLWLPLAALSLLLLVGAGVTSVLARRFPADAQVALAAPVGAAVLACTSPALHLGLSTAEVSLSVLVVFGTLTVASARRVLRALSHLAVPAAVALVALAVTAAPWVARGDWDAAGIATTDPYLWVSEAKALLDGPPPSPAADYPDRLASERIDALDWPVGLPLGVAQIATLAGLDPANAYGAWAVVLAVLLVLAVYAAARACLEWSRRHAVIAALAFSLNALVLYSTFNGWQAQIALTLFGTLALVTYRLALDREASRLEVILPGVFIAAAAAVYGVLVGPFLLMLVAVVAGYAVSHRPVQYRGLVSTSVAVAAAAVVAGLVPLLRSARQLLNMSSAADGTAWDTYAHGLPVEAIGLVPRIGTTFRPPFAWTALATIAGVAVLVFALASLRSVAHRRRDVLLSAGGGAVLVVAALNAPGPSPYVSLKFAAYAAPMITLLALAGVIGRTGFPRIRVAAFGAAAFCFVASTAIVYEQARSHSMTLEPLQGVAASGETLPADARVGIALRDPWAQAWAVYFLRDRKVTVVAPTIYLTGFGLEAPHLSRQPYEYVVDVDDPSRNADARDARAAPILVRRVEPGEAATVLASAPAVGP